MATIRSISMILLIISTPLIANSAASPAVDCTSRVLVLADCLSFVTAGSLTQKPEVTCCSGLKSVLKTDPQCLCEAFKNSAQFGVVLNVTRALALPTACGVSAPSVKNCSLVNIDPPVHAPTTPVLLAPTNAISPSPTSSANEVSVSPASAPANLVSSTPPCVTPRYIAVVAIVITNLIFYSF